MGKADKLCKPKPHPDTYDQRTNGITAEPLVLILVPTRELAMQVYNEARRLCYRSKLRPCTVYGGGPRPLQINDLMRGCDILIGTPGRVCDLVTNCPGVVSLKRLKHTIFDEADELMDPDWESQMAPMLFGASMLPDFSTNLLHIGIMTDVESCTSFRRQTVHNVFCYFWACSTRSSSKLP